MTLTPCKYYALNQCKFGDRCRFSHASTVFQGFGGQQDAMNSLSQKNQQNMDAMIEMVRRDMLEWEGGKIFPFSSYGPSGGKPCLPGLEEDISPEELRYRFYVLNNKVPFDLNRELSTANQARLTYKQITPAVRNILERVILKNEKISSVEMTSTAPMAQNVFGGGSSTSPSLFGGGSGMSQSQPSSLFGQTSSMFGNAGLQQSSQTSSGLFGSSLQRPTSSGVFGGVPQNQSQPQQSIFGGGNSGGLFGSPSSLASPSGGTSSIFGGTATSSIFGGGASTNQNSSSLLFSQSPQQQQTGGLFSSAPNVSVFGSGQTAQPQSLFGQPAQIGQSQPQQLQSPSLKDLLQSPSGQQQQQQQQQTTPSLFGGGGIISQSPQAQGFPPSGSFFGNPQSPQSQPAASPMSIFGTTPQVPQQQPTTPSLFGTPPAQTQQQQQSLFGVSPQPQPQQQQQTQSLFGTPTTALFSYPQQQLSFGGTQSTGMLTGSLAASTTIIQKYVYSEESELSAEDLDAFKATSFTLENIPIKPPPKSLCGR